MSVKQKKMALLVMAQTICIGLAACTSVSERPGPITSHASQPAKTANHREVTPDLEPILEELRAEYGVPALAAAVVKGTGIVQANAVGNRVVDAPSPVTKADRFHLGSITKPITATMIATLVEEGRLTWQSTPASVFPDLAAEMNPALAKVTLEQLLSHRAGLASFTDDAEFEMLPAFTGSAEQKRRAYVKWLLSRKPEKQPGAEYVYSNAGYAVAAVMAEQVSGQSWEHLIRSRIFQPLKMTRSGFGWPGLADQAQPWGHRGTAGKLVPHPPTDAYQFPAVVGPGGDIHASIEDLARFAQLHLRGLTGTPRLLSSPTFKQLHTPVADDYGLGWNQQVIKGNTVSTHLGSAETFFAIIFVSPAQDIAIVVATNAPEEPGQTAAFKTLSALLRTYAPVTQVVK
ncbi:serine hydrolase domain-containing protein [Cognatilysobacter bugurensis]|nr:serine hydrolase domain-containing protein [Lysobacter bugurensis]